MDYVILSVGIVLGYAIGVLSQKLLQLNQKPTAENPIGPLADRLANGESIWYEVTVGKHRHDSDDDGGDDTKDEPNSDLFKATRRMGEFGNN